MLVQYASTPRRPVPKAVFYSYSHADESARNRLAQELRKLQREGLVSTWYDREIRAGQDWNKKILEQIEAADYILLLVSPSLIASEYCTSTEVACAMQRHESGRATVVPIHLKRSDWKSLPFSHLQALPKNMRPAVEWPKRAFELIADELRTLIINSSFPDRPDPASGHHGCWILTVGRPKEDEHMPAMAKIAQIVQDLADDFTIVVEAQVVQIFGGKKTPADVRVFVLTGKPESFNKIKRLYREKTLSTSLGIEVISFEIASGATVQGSSTVDSPEPVDAFVEARLLKLPSRPLQAAVLKGLTIRPGSERLLDFVVDRGGEKLGDEDFAREVRELIDHFRVSLTMSDENVWVNLSMYEADRMLPKQLAGTALGRVMLQQDCLLKRLAASYMHPKNTFGRRYWDAVYEKARSLFGTSYREFVSFQKLWIVPERAEVLELEGGNSSSDFPIDIPDGAPFTYINEATLKVMCECDYLASKMHAQQATTIDHSEAASLDFATAIFSDILLPEISREVNFGEYFAPTRKIYNSVILAAWFKQVHSNRADIRDVYKSVNSDDPSALSITGFSVSDLRGRSSASSGVEGQYVEQRAVHHLFPNAPAFDIAENVEFYEEYLQLFRDGLYKFSLSEQGDRTGERIVRTYFSGGLSFGGAVSAVVMDHDKAVRRSAH